MKPQLNSRRPTLTLVLGLFFVAGASSCVPIMRAASDAGRSAIQADPGRSPLAGPYLTWINEDVRWIITAKEQSSYMALQSNQERLKFIREFWQRHNPDPNSPENRFKDEHYRRIAYANTHFAAMHPGWISDRGRIYIIYGKPDSIDAYPTGNKGETRPLEIWHYRKLRDQMQSGGVDVKFIDSCRCGDYKLDSSPQL